VGDAKYAHWFDGDGAAFACSFEDASDEANAPVTVRAGIKFLRTSRFAAQERAGVDKGVAVRGAWTQADERNFPFANLFRFPTNPSNTAPLVHAGELLALCEGGAPVRVDKRTLDTLDNQSPGSAETKSVFAESAGRRLPMGFSAHAKRDSDGSLYTWGLAAPPSIGVQVARISATGEVTHVVDLPLCASDLNGALSPERLEFALIHDCAMSEKHLVFVVPPWRLRPGFDGKLAKALAGATSFGHAFEWDDRRGAWLVVLRKERPVRGGRA
jgi:carotenoid cleavage dioxygenase-like enzyme